MGIRNAIVTNEDSFKLAEKFPGFFDAILVDAPCSGEGMFRKNVEAIGEWSENNVLKCAGMQKEILDNAAKMLAPGGRMVFSTCTFSPEENECMIQDFLLFYILVLLAVFESRLIDYEKYTYFLISYNEPFEIELEEKTFKFKS